MRRPPGDSPPVAIEPELIDRIEVRGDDLRRMLKELGTINRYLGGTGPSVEESLRRLAGVRRPAILDVGAGGGEYLQAVGQALQERSVKSLRVGLDRSWPTCAAASCLQPPGPGGATFAAADAFRLPYRDGAFDLVHCSLFLHHFREEQIADLLREMRRVSRRGVLVNDLHRHSLAVSGIRILTRLFSRSRFIRHDAPLSVRRAFRRPDLERIWQAAGLPDPEIRWRWAFRWLVWTPASGRSTAGRSGTA